MKFDAKFSQPKTVLKPNFGGTIYTVPGGSSCVDCVKSVNGVLPDADGNVTIHESSSSEEVTQALAKAVPRVTTVILDADKWVENGAYYSQTLELDNITQYSRLDLQPDAAMIEDMRTLGVIFITENADGKITIQSIGNKPSKTYTIQATIVEIKPEIEPDRILGMPVGTTKNTEEAISPKLSVNKEDKTTTLTITDIEGTKTVMINDGADGKSGVHVGEEEPTGNEVVWLDTDGEPDVFVKTVNGIAPDENGNVEVEAGGEEVDLTGYATEKYVDDAIANIDLPTGGNWEFIKTVVLEEDVSSFSFDASGLKAITVSFFGKLNDAEFLKSDANAIGTISTKKGRNQYNGQIGYVRGEASNSLESVYSYKRRNSRMGEISVWNNVKPGTSFAAPSMATFEIAETGVFIIAAKDDLLFKTGSTIKVWGVYE